MDEPFSGLDMNSKNAVGEVIQEVSRMDDLNTIIITTHDITMALKLADTIWILGFEKDNQGKIIPGATCIKQLDLIEMGITWSDNMNTREFNNCYHEICQIFTEISK